MFYRKELCERQALVRRQGAGGPSHLPRGVEPWPARPEQRERRRPVESVLHVPYNFTNICI